jgi:AraC-like DNA-binding protein
VPESSNEPIFNLVDAIEDAYSTGSQRRLKVEGVSFRDVLNMTRERIARHYLRNSNMTGAEISFLLGFEDPNSFFRAFHGWTGTTPERARVAMQAAH